MRTGFRAGPWLMAGAVAGGFAVAAANANGRSLTVDLGSYNRSVSTNSELAQDAFDRGLRLAYGFARADAILAFKEAQAHDPACAMCAWGEAWATGPYQNNPGGVGEESHARAAAERAHTLAGSAAAWERALIAAMRHGDDIEVERGVASRACPGLPNQAA